MGFWRIVITIILPPLGVLLGKGFGWAFIINILLTLLGYIPGLIHAFWVQTRDVLIPAALTRRVPLLHFLSVSVNE